MQKLIALLAFATVCSAQFSGYSYSALAPVGLTNIAQPYKTIVNPYMYSGVVPHVVSAPVAVAKSAYVKDVFTYPYTYNFAPSTVADTAEVALAKAAHFAEYEKVNMRNKRDLYTPSYVAGSYMHPAIYKPYDAAFKTYTTPIDAAYKTYTTPYSYAGLYNTPIANQFYHY